MSSNEYMQSKKQLKSGIRRAAFGACLSAVFVSAGGVGMLHFGEKVEELSQRKDMISGSISRNEGFYKPHDLDAARADIGKNISLEFGSVGLALVGLVGVVTRTRRYYDGVDVLNACYPSNCPSRNA